MIIDEQDYLAHRGILRKSGRYPWGSGGPEYASSKGFLGMVEEFKRQGMSDVEIARGLGISTTVLRNTKSIAKNAEKQNDIITAQKLKDKGYSNVAIGEKMKINESSVRALLKPGELDKLKVLNATSDMLKEQVAEKGYIDIGTGVEYHLNITNDKLKKAVAKLQEEGYTIHYVKVDQLGTSHQTTLKVLAGPDVTGKEMYANRDKIAQVDGVYSDDGGRTYDKIQPPISLSSKRVAVRYAEQGGKDADGVIYVRSGVEDVSLGSARYAQVRVAVDGTHYLKGMAMYRDDLPPGVDVMFNTNKSDTGNKLDAMKKMKDDPDNPFGSVVRQIQKIGPDGKKVVTSSMNIVNEEGNWKEWSKSLSSQFLSKQSPTLVKTQLDMTYERKLNELDEISKLDNPAVKKRLLKSYADDVDSSAVHLKAAALPRQENKVILPVDTLKEGEIYAPTFNNGERVTLVRFPHGGTFEIPELVVNNRNSGAKKALGNAPDAIGIHPKVAEKLSGADFDGDTVLVIPNDRGKIKTAPTLEGLKNFDPQKYKLPDDSPIPRMTARTKGVEMGKISNLITDMSIRGASSDERARAVRHSMVVIDAEKHNLNYRQSALDNGIAQLKTKYQGGPTKGASTLISNSGVRSTTDVPERKQGYKIDPATGKKIFTETGDSYVLKVDKKDKHGKVIAKAGTVIEKTSKVTRLGNVDDAHSLSSGTPVETIYADHSNRLKALANTARKELVSTESMPYSPSAKVAYQGEVTSLNAKLNLALRNAPLERQSQVLGNAMFNQKRDANHDMDASEIKKLKAQSLEIARVRTGAQKKLIEITDREWEAIQAGAISTSKLNQILENSNLERLKELATPKTTIKMTGAKQAQAQAMLRNGYTQAEVAGALGVSVATLQRSVGGDGNNG